MILGSGNIVHNLSLIQFKTLGDANSPAADWNLRFDRDVRSWITKRDFKSLANYATHPDAKLSVPTPEHFLPLLVVAGASDSDDDIQIITEGPDGWSISMTSFAFTHRNQLATIEKTEYNDL